MQATTQASRKAQDQVCSTNSCESFAQFDRVSSCWKTSRQSEQEELTLFSGRWPRQGLMLSGHVFEHRMWEPVIAVTGGGLLPTPNTRDYKDAGPNVNFQKVAAKSKLAGAVVINCKATGEHTYLNPAFVEEMMGFPTGWTESRH